ncbi:anti-sigma factor family protein [Streptomyces sp. NPDC086091]|uniref:anti-sigma factor family protein n=1 Tax=Streptomyces sp. NPDC086091 TaxID=3365751 RepID=UPI00382B5609
MTCEQDREELTVYALAALDQREKARVDRHLRECPACVAALGDLRRFLAMVESIPAQDVLGDWDGRLPEVREAAVRAVLAEPAPDRPVDEAASLAETTDALPPRPVPRPAVAHVTVPLVAHRRGGRVGWALAAAVAGLVLGFGGGSLMPDGGSPDSATLARPAGPSFVRAQDAAGLTGAVEPRATGWGTELVLELSGVDGPQRCALVAVSRDGDRETAVTWQVPEGGYGLPGSRKERLVAAGGVGIPPDRIIRYEIRTTDGKRLLSIPASTVSG